MKYLYYYLILISLISVTITCYDKFASKKLKKHRTPEAILLLLSVFGGSAAMLITMLLIRHKTKHNKFMIGIPLIIILQAALIIWSYQNDYWGIF
jgi:uncharacterized membrane protein YsdA (DUF1294 family)